MGKTIIHMETDLEISEHKARKIAQMIAAMIAVDDLFIVMRGEFTRMTLEDPSPATFAPEIRAAKAAGTFPLVEISSADSLEMPGSELEN